MTYIIAEAGLNHSGKLSIAKKMIEEAAKAGADCIKFQYYDTNDLASKTYQSDLYRQFNECEMDFGKFVVLKNHCKSLGIDFMCTPETIKEAKQLNIIQDVFKISSVGACNIHLLRLVNCFRKPVIVSTGFSNTHSIDTIKKLLKDCELSLLYCISKYPASTNDYDLTYLRRKVVDGISDHTEGIELAVEAASCGAKIIEKHFTLDRLQKGFDHHFSIEPHELKKMVERIQKHENRSI